MAAYRMKSLKKRYGVVISRRRLGDSSIVTLAAARNQNSNGSELSSRRDINKYHSASMAAHQHRRNIVNQQYGVAVNNRNNINAKHQYQAQRRSSVSAARRKSAWHALAVIVRRIASSA